MVKLDAVGFSEIFPNPTVKSVHFQINYPNLFIIENKIGQIQIKIMEKFGDSKLLLRHQFVIGSMEKGKIPEFPESSDAVSKKIWQFHSGDKYVLNISSNTLNITSNIHKSYKGGEDETFRDIIKYVLEKFMEIVTIPIISRIGLRYQDEMPIFEGNTVSLKQFYNTTFDTSRFLFEESKRMFFEVNTERGKYNLNYRELFEKRDDELKYYMDFDIYALKVKPDNYLNVLDEMYEIINIEYDDRITEMFKEHMRRPRS